MLTEDLLCPQPFTLLAKSTRGPGSAQLVMKALAAPGVFVFGELLEVQSIKEASSI
jgi:COP9 signalosome complex subunit 7